MAVAHTTPVSRRAHDDEWRPRLGVESERVRHEWHESGEEDHKNDRETHENAVPRSIRTTGILEVEFVSPINVALRVRGHDHIDLRFASRGLDLENTEDLWCSSECTPPCQGGGRGFKSRQVRSTPERVTRRSSSSVGRARA